MTITTKSGFWADSYAFIDGRHPIERGIARRLNKRGMRDVRALMLSLMGVTAGSAALAQFKRKTAATGQQGGVQAIETADLVNRVSAAGDVTTINARVLAFNPTPTLPANLDGNPRGLASG